MPKKIAKEYYVDNKEFLRLLTEHKKEEKKKNWEEIGKIFLKIATRYLNKPSFIQYSIDWKQDMVTESIYLMVLRWKSFDETRYDNPFAYFTEIAKNAVNKYLDDRTEDAKFVSKIQFIDVLGEDEYT
jgi:hypothetical protein